MHIGWSTNAANGRLDVWYDGAQVVNQVAAQTLADNNSAFTQVGLLRGPADFQDSPIIVLDDGVEGDSLADVHPDLPMNQGGAGATGTTTSATSSAAGTGNGSATSSGTGAGSGGSGGQGAGSGEASGCGCRVADRGEPRLAIAALLALGVASLRRRRPR